MPTREALTEQAEQIKLSFATYLQSAEHFNSMKHEDWRQLIETTFAGTDQHGLKYGIYLTRLSKTVFEVWLHSALVSGMINLDTVTGETSYQDPPESPDCMSPTPCT